MYQVKLVSNYEDKYDKYFSNNGVEFRRIAEEGPDKITQFFILQKMGYAVPEHGFVKDLAHKDYDLIVYTDPTVHDGEGKVLLKPKEALDLYPDCYCSQFIECSQNITTSYKLLQIGKRQFMVRYSSDHDWMSHKSRFTTDILAESPRQMYIPKLGLPIWSIDYICDINRNDMPVAVDFNVAPNLNDIDIHLWIGYDEIAKEIYEAILHYNS